MSRCFTSLLVLACLVSLAFGQASKDFLVREVCSINTPSILNLMFWKNGSLTMDGRQFIVVDPFKEMAIYTVSDLSKRVVHSSPLLIGGLPDPVTGGVFVWLKENAIGGRNDRVTSYDLLYFEDTNRLEKWSPNWTLRMSDAQEHSRPTEIQWISGVQLFAIYKIDLKPTVLFVDAMGKVVGRLNVPGPILGGFDTCDEGLEFFFLSGSKTDVGVMRGVVDATYEKILNTRKISNSYPFHSLPRGTREIRMRGLKQGDIRKFVELVSRVDYWQRNDMNNLGLSPIRLGQMKKTYSVYGSYAKLSFAESPSEYEISPGATNMVGVNGYSDSTSPFIMTPTLYRRSDGIVWLPTGTRVVDAVLSKDCWVISLSKSSGNQRGSEPVVNFSLCTLPLSP